MWSATLWLGCGGGSLTVVPLTVDCVTSRGEEISHIVAAVASYYRTALFRVTHCFTFVSCLLWLYTPVEMGLKTPEIKYSKVWPFSVNVHM